MLQHIALPEQYNHIKEVSINGNTYINLNYSFDNDLITIPSQQISLLIQ